MLSRLSHREKVLIASATAVIALALLLRLTFFPLLDRHSAIKRQLAMKQQDIQKMTSLVKEYQLLASQDGMALSRLPHREASFTLFSFIDQLSKATGVRENVVYMKPSSKNLSMGKEGVLSIVKVKLEGMTLTQWIDFLHGIEKSEKGIRITSLSLTTSGKKRLLTAVMETETVMMERKEHEK